MNQAIATAPTQNPLAFAAHYAALTAADQPRKLITGQQIRLSEVIAGLSVALDITQGHSHGHCMRSCLLGMRIAEELSLDDVERSGLFYALLLKDLGCSSNAARISHLFAADDQEVKHSLRLIDFTRPTQLLSHCWNNMAPDSSWLQRLRKVWTAISQGQEIGRQLTEIRCNRGAEIARMLQLPQTTSNAILDIDEFWNGSGNPLGKKGDEISLFGRICCLAQAVEVHFYEKFETESAYAVARGRRGRWFDPELVSALEAFENDGEFWNQLRREDLLDALANVEPLDQVMFVDDSCLDRVSEAFAKVVDAKSPWTFRHSTRVSEISAGIAEELGYKPDLIKDIRRAALLHDVGKLGVSNRILDKPSQPTPDEFEKSNGTLNSLIEFFHKLLPFQDLAFVAASHHEKLDGSGYHLGLSGSQIPMITRILSVADIFEALTAKRPYRDAMCINRANDILSEISDVSVDANCVEALNRCLDKECSSQTWMSKRNSSNSPSTP